MSKKLVDLHMLVEQDDLDVIDAFAVKHGDRSTMIRHLIHVFCNDLRTGKLVVLPDEIKHQIVDLKKESEDEG